MTFLVPPSVFSVLGPVPVIIVDDLVDDHGDPLLGHFLPEERRIEIKAGMSEQATRSTLMHEKLHVWMWDAGTKPIDDDEEERICDSIGAMLVAETLAL